MENTSAIYVLRLEPKRPGVAGPVLELMPADPVHKGAFGAPGKITARWVHKSASGNNTLLAFSEEANSKKRDELQKKYKTGRSNQPQPQFMRDGMLRYQQECFAALRHQQLPFRILHAQMGEGGRVRLQSCRFRPETPDLTFSISRGDDGLRLQAFVKLMGVTDPLELWTRHHFLLGRDNEYLVLTQRDYATVRWLGSLDLERLASDEEAFVQELLERLEANYTVDRNGCFDVETIDTDPISCVRLSELNGRYLVFTPCWKYEGLEVEGNWTTSQQIKAGGTDYLVHRKREIEEGFMSRLQALHPKFGSQLNGYFYLSFEEAQQKRWFLNTFYSLLEQDVQVLGMSMLEHFRCSPHKPETQTTLMSAPDEPQLRVKFQLRFGEESVPLAGLQKALYAGQRIVLLRDGAMGILSAEWCATWATLVRHARIEKDVLVVPRWMALTGEAGDEESAALRPVVQQGWWDRWQRWQKQDDALYALPVALHAELRPYQQKGYEWLHLLQEAGAGACLADDMGLGKTLQTIAFLCARLESTPGSRHLVICPASLLYNWKQEWSRFAPSVRVSIFQKEEEEADVVLATYHAVRASVEILSMEIFDTIVLDESHQIKNPSAQITRAVGSLQGRFRMALSGTPVLNNTFDLYAQLNFLLPSLFGSHAFFKQQYADPIDRQGDVEKIAALRRLTAPFLLRRTKEQVASDLPEKTEQVLWCNFGNDQRMAYETVREKVRSNVLLEIKERGLEQGKLSVLAGITKLKQVCCSAELVRDEDVFTTESVKTEVLLDELSNLVTGHKVLVFSQYTGMLDLLESAIRKARIPMLRLDGSTPTDQRQGLCNRFNDEAAPERVFLLSLKAGNAGLNLVAADYVFLFDNWWNAAVEQQAIDRTHRIGQTRPVFAYRMICKDTIEEKIWQLQQKKSKLSAELIQAEDGFVKGLSMEDVQFLLD
jgi:superfamily II DNA or RNA helicase